MDQVWCLQIAKGSLVGGAFVRVVYMTKVAATYSPAFNRSTIGATGLNFSVRDGKRWTPVL